MKLFEEGSASPQVHRHSPLLRKKCVLRRSLACLLEALRSVHVCVENTQLCIEYHIFRCVETSIVYIQDDALPLLDVRVQVVLVLLDVSLTFDTTDHLLHLSSFDQIGIPGCTFRWLLSYLTDRKQGVRVDGHLSINVQLRVPQGNILGLLYCVYSAVLSQVFSKLGVSYHIHVDDINFYVDFPCSDSSSTYEHLGAISLQDFANYPSRSRSRDQISCYST